MDVAILCGLYDTLLDAAGTRARWPDACARLAAAAELAAPLAAGLLQGCGLTAAFAAALGPDTLGIARIGPEYYRRACAALRTAPARCIVLDARPLARQWALAAGVAAAFSPAETGWAAVPARLADLTRGWW